LFPDGDQLAAVAELYIASSSADLKAAINIGFILILIFQPFGSGEMADIQWVNWRHGDIDRKSI